MLFTINILLSIEDPKAALGKIRLVEIDTFQPLGEGHSVLCDYDLLEEAMSVAKPAAGDPKECYYVYNDEGTFSGGFDGDWAPEPETIIASKKLEQAEDFARVCHEGKTRDDGKTPYSRHLEQVVTNLRMLGVKDEDMICAGGHTMW